MKAYRAFFQSLIDRLREDHNFTKARVAPLPNWYSFASGFSGIYYSLSFAQGGQVRAEVYIDRGDFDSNKELFDALELAPIGEYRMWQGTGRRLFNRFASCQVRKVASLLAQPLSRGERSGGN